MNEKKSQGSFMVLFFVFLAGMGLFVMETALAFKEYSPVAGFAGSPWIGFAGFTELFSSYSFIAVMRNTAVFGMLYAMAFLFLGTLLGEVAKHLPSMLGEILAVFLVLWLFVPTDVYALWMMRSFGSSWLVDASAMRWLFPLICAGRMVGLPVLCSLCLYRMDPSKSNLPIKISGLMGIASLILGANTFQSLTQALANPLVYETMDMADGYLFRQSFMNMAGSPLGWLQLLFGFLAVSILYVPAKKLAADVFQPAREAWGPENLRNRMISALFALTLFTLVYFLPGILRNGMPVRPEEPGFHPLSSLPVWLLQVAIGAAISTSVAWMISGAFLGKKPEKLAVPMLLLLTIIASAPILQSSYILMRSAGLFNTVFAVMVSSAFSAMAVWALVAVRRTVVPGSADSEMGTPLFGLFLIQTAIGWSSLMPGLVYLSDMRLSPLLSFRQLQSALVSSGDPAMRLATQEWAGALGFQIALPALLLFLLAYMVMPRRSMLIVLAAWSKN